MSGSGKLRRSIEDVHERQLWAVSDRRHKGRELDIRCRCIMADCFQRKQPFRYVSQTPERYQIVHETYICRPYHQKG